MCCILKASTAYMFLKQLFFFLFVCLLANNGYGQGGCMEYNSHLFIINIVNNGESIDDGKFDVFLVNEDSLPYWYENVSVYSSNTQDLTPRKIKRNTPQNARNQKNPYETQNYYPKLNNNWYTCKIPTQKGDKPELLYQALIINKKTRDSIYVYLPYSKSVDICNNNLDRETITDIRFDDGTLFDPFTIDIAVRKPLPLPQYPIKNTYLKFDYSKKFDESVGDTVLQVYQVRVHDKNTLAVIQKIPITGTLPFPANYFKQNIETGDFYNDNPEGVSDFRIMTARVTNEKNQIRSTNFCYYIFDSDQQKYIYDSVLSNSNNVVLKENNPLITKYEISQNHKEKYYDHYKLENGEWIFTERKIEFLLPPFKYTYQKECITWAKRSNGFLPVLQLPSNDKYYTYTDSFSLFNNCPDTLNLSLSHSYSKSTFSLPNKIAPQSKVYLTYNEWLTPFPETVYLIERNTYVYYGDKSGEIKGFSYFVAAPGTEVRDQQTGKIIRYESKKDTLSNTRMVLEVYDSGIPKSYGLINAKNGQKSGVWRNWDENGFPQLSTNYNKKLTVTIGNPERLSKTISIHIKTKTEWITADFEKSGNNLILFVPMDADSIQIICDSARVDAKFIQWANGSEAYFTYYLIKQNEDYVEQNGIRIPITWVNNEYLINWDVFFYSKTKPGSIETEVKYLQSKYPNVLFQSFKYYPQQIVITLLETNPQKLEQTIKNLINESSIGSLSQAAFFNGSGKMAYPEKTATIIVSPYLTYDSIKTIADKYDAILFPIMGSGNYYEFQIKSTLYDKSYIDLLHTINREPSVISISCGWQMDINYLDE